MNGMKKINDCYGHAEGDFCLCAIAEAMQRSAMEKEICIRTGGDEFVVLAKHYDAVKESIYTKLVREEIDKIRQVAGKQYEIQVSIGCYRCVPSPEGVASIQTEAELYLGNADKEMYKEKEGYYADL